MIQLRVGACAAILTAYSCLCPAAAAGALKPVLSVRCDDVPLPADYDPSSQASINKAFQDAPRIFFALGKSRRAALKRLLAHGENPNVCSYGGSVLSHSASRGDVEEVAALLDGGADPDRPLSAAGVTPLFDAIGLGHFDVAELLVSRGADIGFVADGGLTLLHIVAFAMYSEANRGAQLAMAKRLLDAGVVIDARQTIRQTTALMLAALDGNRSLVDFLLQNGADPSLADSRGRTALDFARKKNDAVLIELLQKAASKR